MFGVDAHLWSQPMIEEALWRLYGQAEGGKGKGRSRKEERAARSCRRLVECIKYHIGWFKVNLVSSFQTVYANKELSPFLSVRYCHEGKVLSSGGSDMGSPFRLQQKTYQAAFQDLSAPSVQGGINSYLGRFIFPSLFILLLLLPAFFSAGFSFLVHVLALCFILLLQLPFSNFSAGFQWLRNRSSPLPLPRTTLGDLCSSSGHLERTF